MAKNVLHPRAFLLSVMIGILNITRCAIRGMCRAKCLLPCYRGTISCIQIFLLKAGITRAWFLKFGVQSRLLTWIIDTNPSISQWVKCHLICPSFPKARINLSGNLLYFGSPAWHVPFFIRYWDHDVDVKELSDIRRKLKRAGFWCHWLSVAISLAEDYPMVAVSSLD